jgi:hypothetical protein
MFNVIMIFITSLFSDCGTVPNASWGGEKEISSLFMGIVLGALHEQMWMASIKR